MSPGQEAVQVAARELSGQIKPYKLSKMLKAAAQIMDLMLKSDFGVNYAECLTILDIVRDSILAVKDKEV